MRRHRIVLALTAALLTGFATTAHAQRPRPPRDSAVRAAIDEFVIVVRDMAAARIVTPAAHVPVGGLLDSAGQVESVVGAPPEPTFTPDSLLIEFRRAVGIGARRQKSRAVAIGYLTRRMLPHSDGPVESVMVEVEHVTGYRTDVLYPFIRNEFGEPVFGAPLIAPGTLRTLDARRQRASR
jgi:hypothetical protein